MHPHLSSLLSLVLFCLAGSSALVRGASELLPQDSRQWSQQASAVMLTDLSQSTPAAALTAGRREKGKWKTLPYATAEFKGTALSAYAHTGAPVVRLPLPVKGPHAIYLGVCTVSTGFKEARNGLRARLDTEPAFQRMANNLPLIMPTRVDVIQEQFLSVAFLEGQQLEIGQIHDLPATLCYVKLVPLSQDELLMHEARVPAAEKQTRTGIATFDGHSWLWPYACRTEEDLLANFRGYERSDIGKWWFQVLGADLVTYPGSKAGNIPGEHTQDFPTLAHESFVTTIKALHRAGINPVKVAREEARRQGVEFHIMLRPAGWKACIPYEETFDSRFYEAHPEWRCVDRDGSPTMHMSHAFPEVRQHLLDIYRETLELQPEGVGLLFNRGMPMMLWEEPFCARFRAMHQAEAREVPEDDPRIHATRATIMTDFLREIRALLDETARAQGPERRYKISLGTFSKEVDNQKFGFDLPRWIREGLVDDLGVAWFAHHTSFAQPDMAYYKKLVAGTQVGVYPFVIAWKTGTPQEFCKRITAFYQGGASGIAIWDPTVEGGWTGKSHGNLFDTLRLTGHRDIMARWAKDGVPLPLSLPLTQLGENHYSRWFPTTGF